MEKVQRNDVIDIQYSYRFVYIKNLPTYLRTKEQ